MKSTHLLNESEIAFVRGTLPEAVRALPTEPFVSDRELERRWKAARSAMESQGIDVLIMAGYNAAGYMAWFCDVRPLPASGINSFFGGMTFPRDDEMTLVFQGLEFGQDTVPTGWRGFKRMLGIPPSTTAPYAKHYYAKLFAKALEPYARGTIGIVGQMASVDVEYLRSTMPSAKLVEATELVDAIKVKKSEEEWGLIMRSARMTEQALEAAFAAIEPGMKTGEIASIAEYVVRKHGVYNGTYMYNSAPRGTATRLLPFNPQRVLSEGDVIYLLVECPGPGGMFTEIARTAVIGRPTAAMQEELEFAVRAQHFTASLLRPGTPCKDVFAEYNAFMEKNGRPTEKRLHAHGQGYDLQVERPLVRFDETMCVERDMNFAIHPMYTRNDYFSFVCDNFRVDHSGPAKRIHTLPQKIFEVGSSARPVPSERPSEGVDARVNGGP